MPLAMLDARSTIRSSSSGFMPEASCVSRSIQSGSSVKNFGTAADPSIVVAATAASRAEDGGGNAVHGRHDDDVLV